MDNQQAKIIWFGGFFDGEGSLMFYKDTRNSYYPRITLCNTSFKTKERVIEIYTEMTMPFHYSERTPSKDQKSWDIRLQGYKRCLKWLDVFQEYLYTKHEEATMMRKVVEYRLLPSSRCWYDKRIPLPVTDWESEIIHNYFRNRTTR
jgi:hypothetical protein